LALRVVITGLSLLYIVYLLSKARKRPGRVLAFAVWLGVTAISFVFGFSAFNFILTQGFLIWLIRSFTRYKHLLPGLIDGCVVAVGLTFAFWAAIVTGSLLVSLWCFFLMQSLFALIPNRALPFQFDKSPLASQQDNLSTAHNFERAARSAQIAIKQLSNFSSN
jgi:hypothetical protein